ncbi:hypothetical protein Ddye_024473 [Dipteronia dyeriana]|uniref:Uncharacterized protein n=1 Tax=Dipteronia dyeriana TaxID=168575 RepID=A0AAD9TUV7_9ROSI|nr:hypothetical protein Ddye_024473 [Dipteronia dyeriana]
MSTNLASRAWCCHVPSTIVENKSNRNRIKKLEHHVVDEIMYHSQVTTMRVSVGLSPIFLKPPNY